jgi:hypothetical protein
MYLSISICHLKNVLDSFTVKLSIKNLKKKLFPHNIIIPFLCGAVKFVFLPTYTQPFVFSFVTYFVHFVVKFKI